MKWRGNRFLRCMPTATAATTVPTMTTKQTANMMRMVLVVFSICVTV